MKKKRLTARVESFRDVFSPIFVLDSVGGWRGVPKRLTLSEDFTTGGVDSEQKEDEGGASLVGVWMLKGDNAGTEVEPIWNRQWYSLTLFKRAWERPLTLFRSLFPNVLWKKIFSNLWKHHLLKNTSFFMSWHSKIPLRTKKSEFKHFSLKNVSGNFISLTDSKSMIMRIRIWLIIKWLPNEQIRDSV